MNPPLANRLAFAALALLTVAAAPCARAADASPFDPNLKDFVKRFKAGGALGDQTIPRPTPAQSLTNFQVVPGLQMSLAASEPAVRQPLNMHFDERGRLWVVQYLQYPFPAGLKVVKYDQYLRAVFDKVPPAPPHHFKGADRITIYEDTDGDGVFEKSRDFLSDLNLARSVVTGRGGVWVLNPPYLLFYPDRDRDDRPDADPEVHLSGFGIEDTHSGANSLAWGPDGWLYGAHGSTCTATIKGIRFLGQAIWRYHPRTREFEVFAEGGGNTYSLEFDRKGRAFSGTNYGDTRGVHYEQGGAYIKGWGKHGPLMNPYSFGWFEHMSHSGYKPRFPQAMLIYEGGAIPQLTGQIVAGMALTSRVQGSSLSHDTSTFRTTDTETLVTTPEKWFRPVDIKTGPDGGIYIADWCDTRLSHLDPRDTWDKESGRIYRLHVPGAKGSKPFDLAKFTGDELIATLTHPNKWFRQTALRLLYDRTDASLLPRLKQLVMTEEVPSNKSEKIRPSAASPLITQSLITNHSPLEFFWAVNACGGFDDAFALQSLAHPDEFIRLWTLRLLGDSKKISPALQAAALKRAQVESSSEVRAQLASTCKRLPGPDALPIVRELLLRADDAKDKHIPLLLWWALENKAITDRDRILRLFEDSTFWHAPIVSQFIVQRLGRRYTAGRTEDNLRTAARLFTLAPTPDDTAKLITGMEEGLQGDALATVPPELRQRVAEVWSSQPPTPTLISFALRLGHPPAAEAALARVADRKTPDLERRKLMVLLAERGIVAAIPVFLDLLRAEKSEATLLELVNALQRFNTPEIPRTLLDNYAALPTKARAAAQTALASRTPWARELLTAVDTARLKKEQITIANLLAMQNLQDTTCAALIQKHWGRLTKSSEEKEAQITRVRALLATGKGDAKSGRELFKVVCATCHKLNNEGANIGPDLTGYERDNLDFILPAIVDPSLAIREEYTAFNVSTKDGQSLTGFLLDNTPQSVTISDLNQNKLVIARRDLQSLQASLTSLMPEGLLEAMTETQIRDLFAYFTAGVTRSATNPK